MTDQIRVLVVDDTGNARPPSSIGRIRALGIRVSDVEHSIGRKVDETIVSDGRSVVYALNRGVPFFLSNRESQVSQDVLRLARSVVGEPVLADERKSGQKKSLFAWR
jgi:MinD-like ATPase involved in chromosome partitioning or flagellar assembly